ncbi:uncharacterized protein [Dermacentor andersoni]|uniref:uncharacterized protein n=1 Tax=Dermacentor andersoni TaxID=34620 RepID=UPI003B3B7F48
MSSNQDPADSDKPAVDDQLQPVPVVLESKHGDSGESQPTGPKGDSAVAGESRAPPSTSAATCEPGGSHELEGVDASKSSGSESGTAEVSTQTDKSPVFRHRPNCTCRRGRRTEQELGSSKEKGGSRICASTGAHTTSGSPKYHYHQTPGTPQVFDNDVKANSEGEGRHSRERRWGLTSSQSFHGDFEECPHRSAAERKRSVEESLNEAREILHALLHEILDEAQQLAPTSSLSGIVFDEELPGKSSHLPPSSDPHSTYLHFQLTGDLRSAVDPILDSLEDLEDESLDPRGDARHYIIGDELFAVYEHIEARWGEICEQIGQDMNCRYTQFVADCRNCLEAEAGEPERRQLRRDMAEARRHLISQMQDDFRGACDCFNDWRARYLQHELRRSCTALFDGDRFSVLASLLRYEILDCLPDLEKRSEERAAEFWKELVEHRWRDVDGFFKDAE